MRVRNYAEIPVTRSRHLAAGRAKLTSGATQAKVDPMGNRTEFIIEEAGSFIWLAPTDLAGVAPAELLESWEGLGSESMQDLVLRGVLMPMGLYQDDGYVVRLVVGDLTNQEETEWTARVRWKLDARCGRILVSGILTPDFESEFAEIVPAEDGGSYFYGAHVEVPPEPCIVEVYSYPPNDLSSGWGLIADADLYGQHPGIEPEEALDYFRRTRPGETPPAWIEDGYDEEVLYVDFVVRVSPMDELPPPTLEEDGSIGWEFRKPEVCPLGITATVEESE